MAQYTQLSTIEIEEIAAGYGLAVSSFEAISGGAENTSYQLSTERGKFVLTLFESKTMEETQRLGKLLRYLEAQSFPSSRVLSLADESVISRIKGKPLMLKHYIEGQTVMEMSEDMLQQLGSELARLHAIPAPDYLESEPAFGLRRIRKGLAEVRDEAFRRWLSDRVARVEHELAEDLPSGLVHADLFADNILFEGVRLLALIDFEDAGRTKLVYDLGMAIVGTCLVGTEIAWPKARSLVKGYESVRALERREQAGLQAGTELGALSTAYWRYWKYNILHAAPERADKHLEMKTVAEKVSAISKRGYLQRLID